MEYSETYLSNSKGAFEDNWFNYEQMTIPELKILLEQIRRRWLSPLTTKEREQLLLFYDIVKMDMYKKEASPRPDWDDSIARGLHERNYKEYQEKRRRALYEYYKKVKEVKYH